MATLNGVKVLNVVKTKTQWEAITAVPSKGVLLVEVDGNKTNLKIGDGVNTYNLLPYASGDIDLSAYYTAAETDEAIATAVSSIGNIVTLKGRVDTTAALPSTGNTQGDLYFVGLSTATNFDEYVWTSMNGWEKLGTTSVDLSNYYTKAESDAITDDLAESITALEDHAILDTDTLVINCTI